jgi:quercetin dioxygenase-like cupin family protein
MESNDAEPLMTEPSGIEKPGISFSDERGFIKNLVNRPCGGVQVIFSRQGAKRSSHYHREDGHVLYVLEGMMELWERPVGSTEPPTRKLLMRGEQVYTGPGVEHWVRFPVDTTLISISDRPRDHESHESDVVRVEWFE